MSVPAGSIYDRIGDAYARLRQADHRIARRIAAALGDAATVVNVGAGAGSYEPDDRFVIAVEPSMLMIRQRPFNSAPVVRASATRLPFVDGAFAAALAVLTVHHWPDRERGLAELARVASDRVVVLTWDPESPGFWLQEYFPQILEIDRKILPAIAEFRRALGPIEVAQVPIPHDCSDGFLGAYWRRPEAYRENDVRRSISTFAKLGDPSNGLARLRCDLADGSWHRRFGSLLEMTELDMGYRLLISTGRKTRPPR